MHPYQFLSLYSNLQEGLKSVTDKKVLELSPRDIVSQSKIYNLVNALQFRELYGMDFIRNFLPSSIELKHAQDFYEEYLQYRNDREPGEEYDLVQHWAEDLHIDKYFELIPETEYRTKRVDIDNLLQSIENDPFGLETNDPKKDREMEKFQQGESSVFLINTREQRWLDARIKYLKLLGEYHKTAAGLYWAAGRLTEF